jgi:hypothetical protein
MASKESRAKIGKPWRGRCIFPPFMGTSAHIRLVASSSGGWRHINFDDVRFDGTGWIEESIPFLFTKE